MNQIPGAKIDLNLDELFQEDANGATPTPEDKKLELTQAVTKRINEVRAKTETEVRDKIAKDLGFENYEAMQKAKDKMIITEAGLDAEAVEKIIEPMLAKRLQEDPRMQKLQALEEQEKKNYIANQLAEIEKLTGLKVSEADLDKNTMTLWEKGIDLSAAFIAANPTKVIGAGSKGSTTHLSTGGGGTGQPKLRPMTAAEKDLYRSIDPSITDEELNKKTLEVK